MLAGMAAATGGRNPGGFRQTNTARERFARRPSHPGGHNPFGDLTGRLGSPLSRPMEKPDISPLSNVRHAVSGPRPRRAIGERRGLFVVRQVVSPGAAQKQGLRAVAVGKRPAAATVRSPAAPPEGRSLEAARLG